MKFFNGFAQDLFSKLPTPFGVMIAGNAGRPLGMLNKKGRIDFSKVYHSSFHTQEESVLQYIILQLRQQGKTENDINKLFKPILESWGFSHDDHKSTMTKQGFDYTVARDMAPYDIAYTLDLGSFVICWVFGPNANGSVGTPTGSMQRTYSGFASNKYYYFSNAIYTAINAGVNALKNKVKTIILAGVSTGVYAGPWKQQIRRDYNNILKNFTYSNKEISFYYPIQVPPCKFCSQSRITGLNTRGQFYRVCKNHKCVKCSHPKRYDKKNHRFFDTCCRTCYKSNGSSHGKFCCQENK